MRKLRLSATALALMVALALPAGAQDQRVADGPDPIPLVEVQVADEDELLDLLGAGLDVFEVDQDALTVEIIAHDFEQDYLAEADFDYDVVNPNVNVFPEESGFSLFGQHDGRTEYRHLEDFYEEIEAINEQYPDMTRVQTIGHGHEGNPIVVLEIASDVEVDDGRPQHVHTGVQHAREWPTAEYVMDLGWYLVENYGSDERVTDIVDNVRVFLLPVYNPDGYHYSRTEFPLHRKNRNPDGTVDLNRNFPHMWGGPGSSGNPNSNTYRGQAPGSEPETQAFLDFVNDKHVITTIHSHTHGGMWLYPWAHTHDPPEDEALLAELAARATELTGWRDGQWSHVLYDASGESTDTSYGVYGSLSFLPEHGYGHGFHWNYTGTLQPGVLTDVAGDFEARLLSGSPALDGQSGTLVDCGLGLSPDACPADVDGNIALVERGAGTFAEKALNAEAAGADGVVIYNNQWGHVTGHLSGADVSIPVVGFRQFYGQQLLQAMAEGPVEATLQEFITHSVRDVWDLNLPAFLLTIEAAQEQAARIQGSVTDVSTGEPLSARLGLETTIQYSTYQGETWDGVHGTSTDVSEDGEFDWHVLPSRQPLVGTPPYELTVESDNYFPQSTSFPISDYQQVVEVDFELQELANVLPPYGQREVTVNSTLPFRFETFAADGSLNEVDSLEVAVYDEEGTELHRYFAGRGSAAVRDVGRAGQYQVQINTRALGLDAGTYAVGIEFQTGGDAYEYTVPLEVVD